MYRGRSVKEHSANEAARHHKNTEQSYETTAALAAQILRVLYGEQRAAVHTTEDLKGDVLMFSC